MKNWKKKKKEKVNKRKKMVKYILRMEKVKIKVKK